MSSEPSLSRKFAGRTVMRVTRYGSKCPSIALISTCLSGAAPPGTRLVTSMQGETALCFAFCHGHGKQRRNSMSLKTSKCRKCGLEKDMSAFYVDKRDGRPRRVCKICVALASKERRKASVDIVSPTRKTCSRCGANLPISAFVRDRGRKCGYRCACKFCEQRAIRQRREINPERNRLQVKRSNSKFPERAVNRILRWEKNNPHKQYAKMQVRYEVNAGRIKPEPCCVCGFSKGNAHHVDYRKPLQLMWLCQKHHRAWHRVFMTEDL